MKKSIILFVSIFALTLSVANAQKFTAPSLTQEKASKADSDQIFLANEKAKIIRENRIAEICAKKTSLLQNAKDVMLKEVAVALSNADREKAFEQRDEAWKHYADAKQMIEKSFEQEILEAI
ncbi:MAG: hypothetical protein ACK5N8_04115 [Alphaproteobacteria bacterium]